VARTQRLGHTLQHRAGRRVIAVDLWGVVHGVEAFTAAMVAQGTPAAIVNTGSKQGITNPPGNAAYNVAKAGEKALTEQLAHGFRETPGCRVTAHLLVPGFTFTGINAPPGAAPETREKPRARGRRSRWRRSCSRGSPRAISTSSARTTT
jgi:NAD(P)-dependent dehydrogenase (short-subunit alcohol dehydrogenase family)